MSPDAAVLLQEQRTIIKKRVSSKAYRHRRAERLSRSNQLEQEKKQQLEEDLVKIKREEEILALKVRLYGKLRGINLEGYSGKA